MAFKKAAILAEMALAAFSGQAIATDMSVAPSGREFSLIGEIMGGA